MIVLFTGRVGVDSLVVVAGLGLLRCSCVFVSAVSSGAIAFECLKAEVLRFLAMLGSVLFG